MYNCPYCGSDHVEVYHDEELIRSHFFCSECGSKWSRAGINRKGPATPKQKNPLFLSIVSVIFALLVLVSPFMADDSTVSSDQIATNSTISENTLKSTEDTSTVTRDLPETEENTSTISESQSSEVLPKDEIASNDSATTENTPVVEPEEKEGTLEITMLDVGQGLSILINADGEYMLYDGGGREASSYVVAYLKEHEITELKYLVASHYDEDHIAGLVGVLNKYSVETALTPDYETDTGIYASFKNKIKEQNVTEIHPSCGEIYTLGASEFQILGPENYSSSEDNNNSIVIKGVLNDFSYLLTGDAEEIEEFQLMNSDFNLDSTLYVVGHHGSQNSSSYEFLQKVNPEIVMISAGAENSYGHPAEATMSRLKELNINMFRSDKQGEVTLTTDGHEWQTDKESCNDWSDGYVEKEVIPTVPIVPTEPEITTKSNETRASVDTEKEETRVVEESKEPEEPTYDYVLNTNTRKFHHPTCRSVKQMKDKNKAYRESVTRESVIQEGYDPCGNCNP